MKFAADVLKLVDKLPKTPSGYAVAKQLARSGTGVGANYRAVRTSRSRAEFIAKLGVVVEEADESTFWLDLVVKTDLAEARVVQPLRREACELLAIFSRSLGTARFNQRVALARGGQMAT